jgi:hypothetical protein
VNRICGGRAGDGEFGNRGFIVVIAIENIAGNNHRTFGEIANSHEIEVNDSIRNRSSEFASVLWLFVVGVLFVGLIGIFELELGTLVGLG